MKTILTWMDNAAVFILKQIGLFIMFPVVNMPIFYSLLVVPPYYLFEWDSCWWDVFIFSSAYVIVYVWGRRLEKLYQKKWYKNLKK